MFSIECGFCANLRLSEPQFIIMAMHAHPTPVDPYNPTGDQHEQLRHPSPFIPIRIPLFSPVVWINDLVIRAISLIGSVGGAAGRSNPGSSRRLRALSDSVESVEEGEGFSLEPLNTNPGIRTMQAPRVVSTRIRVNRGGGGGRKYD